MNYLEGKIVIVTGGTSGLGKSLVLQLINLGAKVAFCGRSEEKIKTIIKEVGENSTIFYDTFEITDETKIFNFVKDVEKKLGPVDVLINCAGANTSRASVKDIHLEDFQYMMNLNTIAPLNFIKACYPYMSDKKQGLIVNILSTCCLFSNEGLGSYTASKAALDSLTKVLRKEARKDNIRVCSVYPGGINTSFRPQAREEYLSADIAAETIINSINIDERVALDEIVLRPFIETNYR
ncbi:SDR family oxidoreductase [Clostridium sp. UBA1652]|uniref:SDR family oxidoreductase n=1 Tax=Clostridium sp. UBA1652 TaxID=1946348 RepID=UPI00257FC3F5|nr:SDR family oxidoreductase [Clostridium sp. UBA1652]